MFTLGIGVRLYNLVFFDFVNLQLAFMKDEQVVVVRAFLGATIKYLSKKGLLNCWI